MLKITSVKILVVFVASNYSYTLMLCHTSLEDLSDICLTCFIFIQTSSCFHQFLG